MKQLEGVGSILYV